MNTRAGIRTQLASLDRALAALLDERARLVTEAARDGADLPRAAVDDLLRRSSGPFPPDSLREVFAAIDSGCTP